MIQIRQIMKNYFSNLQIFNDKFQQVAKNIKGFFNFFFYFHIYYITKFG
jgi:hypothetical protein